MNIVIENWLARIDTSVTILVDAEMTAVSKERPRVGKSGHMYTPKRTQDFERSIARACPLPQPVTYPVKISVSIVETPPKTWPVEKRQLALAGLILPTRGDLDNQVKAITDGLNGVAYLDDVQISRIDAERRYGPVDRILVTMIQTGLSQVQIDHAVASLKNYKADTDEQGSADRSGS